MSTRINDDSMSLEIGDCVIAAAQFREHTAADGHGAWIVSSHPSRLFTRNQAITAIALAERLAAGDGDDDPSVLGWRESASVFVTWSSSSRFAIWWASASAERSCRAASSPWPSW